MNISNSFDLREVVHPDIYNHPAIGERCADFIHPSAGDTLEAIKIATDDVITINDWMWKGVDEASYTNSGLRLPMKQLPSRDQVSKIVESYLVDDNTDKMWKAMNHLYKDIGAIFSSHKFGCGFDLKFKHMTAQEAHAFILKNQHLFPNITRMEAISKTPTWVHLEVGEARAPGVDIVVFNP